MTIVESGIDALTALSNTMADPGGEVGCHVFIRSPGTRTRKKIWFKVAMEPDVTTKIVSATDGAIEDILREARTGHLAEFDFDAMVDGDMAVLKVEDVEALLGWFEALPADTLDDTFNGDPAIAKRADLFVRRLTFPGGKSLVAVTGKGGLDVYIGKKGKVAAFFSEQKHEMQDIKGAILTLDGRIDFLLWEGLVFVQRLRTFESLTHVREATTTRAEKAIESCSILFNFGPSAPAVLARISAQPALAKRLAAAHKYGYMADMTGPRLRDRAIEKQLNIQFVEDEITGGISLQIDETDKRQIEDLVDLLSEFFLKSPATGREYDVRVKRPARARRGGR
jgi:hypothetical protein